MRAVITVIGKDMVGILAKGLRRMRRKKASTSPKSPSPSLQDLFAMIMLVDIGASHRAHQRARPIRFDTP